MAPANKKWQKDVGEVMQQVPPSGGSRDATQSWPRSFRKLRTRPLTLCDDSFLKSFGCRHGRRGLRRGRNTAIAGDALMIGELQLTWACQDCVALPCCRWSNAYKYRLLCPQLRKIKRCLMIGCRQHSQEFGEATLRIAGEMNVTHQ